LEDIQGPLPYDTAAVISVDVYIHLTSSPSLGTRKKGPSGWSSPYTAHVFFSESQILSDLQLVYNPGPYPYKTGDIPPNTRVEKLVLSHKRGRTPEVNTAWVKILGTTK